MKVLLVKKACIYQLLNLFYGTSVSLFPFEFHVYYLNVFSNGLFFLSNLYFAFIYWLSTFRLF